MFRSAGIRVTLLTAGLLLKSQAQLVAESVDDVIVSRSTALPAIHNRIRRVPDAFERLAEGVSALQHLRPDMPVRARCTVQKANFSRSARSSALRKDRTEFGFIPRSRPDFQRLQSPGRWQPDRSDRVALTSEEVDALGRGGRKPHYEHRARFGIRICGGNPPKLTAHCSAFSRPSWPSRNCAPRCNAPWVSAVIEASGDVRPCFFHPALGNIHQPVIAEISIIRKLCVSRRAWM